LTLLVFCCLFNWCNWSRIKYVINKLNVGNFIYRFVIALPSLNAFIDIRIRLKMCMLGKLKKIENKYSLNRMTLRQHFVVSSEF
jgi:hypothetical protein